MVLSRGYVVLVSSCGFIFGQVFFGSYDSISTIAGVSGVSAGIFGGHRIKTQIRSITIISLCMVSIVAVAFDIFRYYSKDHVAGNYYPWFGVLPYCAALLLIANNAKNSFSSNENDQAEA